MDGSHRLKGAQDHRVVAASTTNHDVEGVARRCTGSFEGIELLGDTKEVRANDHWIKPLSWDDADERPSRVGRNHRANRLKPWDMGEQLIGHRWHTGDH